MRRLWYLSHPQVTIDPATPVPDWGLSALGLSRVRALVARGWHGQGAAVFCSPERKARETAMLLAAPRLPQVVPDLAEVDRSATGYVPHDRHQALAQRLFAHPAHSADGWETAVAAQARTRAALAACLAQAPSGDLVVVGHGGVGTLLWLALNGTAIAPGHDQPGQGYAWAASVDAQGAITPTNPWHPYEALA